ncbi:MAG: aminotransferase class I/II-fold pyridoxal phosphate-dependent enzyme [Elusimicrobiota bacterium]
MNPACSKKLSSLPPYLFVRLSALRRQAEAKGLSVIDLGQGSPDLPSPPHVIAALKSSADEAWTHRYPPAAGIPELREAIADWYRRRFSVDLDPVSEVVPLIGSKEGIAHLLMALLDPGQGALVPNPCYPVHYNGPALSGGKIHLMPLTEENGFLPDFSKIPTAQARSSKVVLLNYPNNPTGAVVEGLGFLKEAVAFSRRYGCLVAYDNAYSEITFDGYKAPSILQVPGAKKRAVEFHSLSKTYSMAGWRLGFAVGNAEVLGHLSKFKGFLDYGIPAFIQKAGIAALNGPQDCVETARLAYQSRRDALVGALASAGWSVPKSRAGMYLWGKLPARAAKKGSMVFVERLIMEQGVVISPGVGFGPLGEGYARFSLVAPEDQLREAARRIGRFLGTI